MILNEQRKFIVKKKKIALGIIGKGQATPPSFGNLYIWFANLLSGIGCPICTWTSELGYGGQLNGSTGVLALNCPYIELQNFHSVIRFEGNLATTFLAATTPLVFFQNVNTQFWDKSFTALGIMRQDGVIPSNGTFHAFKANTNDTAIALFSSGIGSDTLYFTVRSNNSEFVQLNGGVIYAQGWKIICWQWDFPNRTAKLIINGNVYSGTNLLMDSFDFRQPTSGYNVGQFQDIFGVFSNPLTGVLGEFFYYSDVKNNAVINALGSYLSAKYGIGWINI